MVASLIQYNYKSKPICSFPDDLGRTICWNDQPNDQMFSMDLPLWIGYKLKQIIYMSIL